MLGEQEIDDSFCRRRAAVKQDGAEQRFDGVGEDGRALRAAGTQLAGTERQVRVDAERKADCGQRRLLDERRAGTAQIALGIVGPKLEEPARNREVEERVAEILEALVVGFGRAAMRQREVEKRRRP